MPNYCTNDLTLTHTDAALVLKAHDAFKEGKLLETFIPCPRALRETEAVHYPSEPEDRETQIMAERQAAIEAINIKHYGFKNWYDWCVAHWGTKWDVGGQRRLRARDDWRHFATLLRLCLEPADCCL
jgi:hypothetical protein